MDKEKFFSGLWIIAGLILGSLFTNFIYQDYLAYGGQVQYLVFHNQKLYSASMSLFFYILFKRVKQYAMIYLAGYLLKPWFDVITSDHTDGNERIISCAIEFVSAVYFIWNEPYFAHKTKFSRRKKGRNAL